MEKRGEESSSNECERQTKKLRGMMGKLIQCGVAGDISLLEVGSGSAWQGGSLLPNFFWATDMALSSSSFHGSFRIDGSNCV
jgi:hypothetical protein